MSGKSRFGSLEGVLGGSESRCVSGGLFGEGFGIGQVISSFIPSLDECVIHRLQSLLLLCNCVT